MSCSLWFVLIFNVITLLFIVIGNCFPDSKLVKRSPSWMKREWLKINILSLVLVIIELILLVLFINKIVL